MKWKTLMKLMRCLLSVSLIALGFYILTVEQSFISSSLRDAYDQLSDESRKSRVGRLLWTSRGVHHLHVLGSLVWMVGSFILCLDLIAWRKGNARVIVATMFSIAYLVVNFLALATPFIPGDFASWFGVLPIFPACAIIATWVFFWKSRANLKRWKLAGIVFTACFLFLGGYNAYVLNAIWASI